MEKLQNTAPKVRKTKVVATQVGLFQVAEINVTYRPKFKASERPKVGCSKDLYSILFNNWDLNKIELQEQFKIVLLNRANKVLGIYKISTGGMS